MRATKVASIVAVLALVQAGLFVGYRSFASGTGDERAFKVETIVAHAPIVFSVGARTE